MRRVEKEVCLSWISVLQGVCVERKRDNLASAVGNGSDINNKHISLSFSSFSLPCVFAPPRQRQRHIGRPLIGAQSLSFSQGARAPRKRKSNVYRYIIIWITGQLTSLLLSTGVCVSARVSAGPSVSLQCASAISAKSTRTRDIRHKQAVVMCPRSFVYNL